MSSSREVLLVRGFLAILGFLTVLLSAAVARSAPPEVIDNGGNRLVIQQPDGRPVGSVILIPGGSTLMDISKDGTPDASLINNFVIRTREQYVSAGFVTAMLDDPSNLGDVITRLRAIARPVFLVSTSRGTIVAAKNATSLGDKGPDGIVLTSPITVEDQGTVLDFPIERIKVPVLIVVNDGDTCRFSPPSGAKAITYRLNASLVTEAEVSSSQQLSANPCQAETPHGYLGIEDDTVARIILWMRAHIATAPGR